MSLSTAGCKRIGSAGQLRMAAIHRERVLRQVVAADREEVHRRRDALGGERGGGRFDHRADFDGRAGELRLKRVDCVTHGAHFRNVRDHRQENAHDSRRRDSQALHAAASAGSPDDAAPCGCRAVRARDSLRAAAAGSASGLSPPTSISRKHERPAAECRRRWPDRRRTARPRLARASRSMKRNSVRSRPQPSAPAETAASASARLPRLAKISIRVPSRVRQSCCAALSLRGALGRQRRCSRRCAWRARPPVVPGAGCLAPRRR